MAPFSSVPRRKQSMRAAEHYQRRINVTERKSTRILEEHRAKIHSLRTVWTQTRDWNGLQHYLSSVAGINLMSELRTIAQRQSVIRILEDGPGFGFVAAGLKHDTQVMLKRNLFPKKKVQLEAVVLHSNLLLESERGTSIDTLHVTQAESFIPKQQPDLILSLAGSVNYAHRSQQKDHLLKLSHSLRHGGLLVAAVSLLQGEGTPLSGGITDSFLQKPMEGKKKISLEQEQRAIVRSFEKQGFKAQFWHNKAMGDFPNYLLIVRKPLSIRRKEKK